MPIDSSPEGLIEKAQDSYVLKTSCPVYIHPYDRKATMSLLIQIQGVS